MLWWQYLSLGLLFGFFLILDRKVRRLEDEIEDLKKEVRDVVENEVRRL